jgi:DNA replicative helicase MCM subunit Mcm2 (Cdc46/Mcm family)
MKTNLASKLSNGVSNTNNKINSLTNLNKDFYSLIQNFDIIYIFNDKIDFQKDKKMMRNIIENQFYNNKKRCFNEMKTQFDPKNENDIIQILNISSFNEGDIDSLEHTDSLQFFKSFNKHNLQKLEKSETMKDILDSDSQILLKYCMFANNYIFPKISEETYHKILFVGESIKSIYSLLKSSDFDIFSKAVRLLTM